LLCSCPPGADSCAPTCQTPPSPAGRLGVRIRAGDGDRRQALAAHYRAGLASVPGITPQRIPEGDRSTYKDFTVIVDESTFGLRRDELMAALARCPVLLPFSPVCVEFCGSFSRALFDSEQSKNWPDVRALALLCAKS